METRRCCRWNGYGCQQNRCEYFIPLCIGVVMVVTYLFWMCLNIMLFLSYGDEQEGARDVFINLQFVYQALGYFLIIIGEPNLPCYHASVIFISTVQFLCGSYLLWGVIERSEGKLKIWLIYGVMSMGVASLYFIQVLSRPRAYNFETEIESDGMFWTQYIGRVVLFLVFNGFYIYSINSMRDKVIIGIETSPITAETDSMDLDLSGRGSGSTSFKEYPTELCVVFVSVLNFVFYGFKVLTTTIYMVCLAFGVSIGTISIIDSGVYLVIGLLGLIFTYMLWLGNTTRDSGKIVLYMGFQITTSLFLYGWLVYWTVTGLSFDFVVLKFSLTFLLSVISIYVVSKRSQEIEYDAEYRRIQQPEDQDDYDMLHLMDLSTATANN